jgi:hypothetical protein
MHTILFFILPSETEDSARVHDVWSRVSVVHVHPIEIRAHCGGRNTKVRPFRPGSLPKRCPPNSRKIPAAAIDLMWPRAESNQRHADFQSLIQIEISC